jgi:ABC-type Fe3+ transport system substrate-binding protein
VGLRIAIVVSLVLLIGLPFVMRPEVAAEPANAARLIIITPHNEQIRTEFGRAFSAWHERQHGRPVSIAWSTPGGTSEIRKMLVSEYTAALVDQRRDDDGSLRAGGNHDLMFGGGSYEHGVLKQTISAPGIEETTTISVPVDFDPAWLSSVYGDNRVGDGVLYDPERHWFGTALSGFGIVYNREVLAELGVPEPVYWSDLADPALRGWIALVNPGQSGSITTAFDAILQQRGWERGWQILRRAAANARYFSASSPRAPIDVSLGDAAVGICIDFYGRYQSQAVKDAGGGDRVGYVDPPGVTMIDPDPISMLRGAPHADVARRFIEFCLTPEAQSLWQFRDDDPGEDGLGPARFELRRMPVLRSMYEPAYFDRFIDRANPFEIARPFAHPNRNIRSFVAPLFAGLAIENHEQLRHAWEAIVAHPAYPDTREIVTAADVDDPELAAMLGRFDAMPAVAGPGGTTYDLADPETLGAVKTGWLRSPGWRDEGLWPRDASPADVLRRDFVAFFREQYERIADE